MDNKFLREIERISKLQQNIVSPNVQKILDMQSNMARQLVLGNEAMLRSAGISTSAAIDNSYSKYSSSLVAELINTNKAHFERIQQVSQMFATNQVLEDVARTTLAFNKMLEGHGLLASDLKATDAISRYAAGLIDQSMLAKKSFIRMQNVLSHLEHGPVWKELAWFIDSIPSYAAQSKFDVYDESILSQHELAKESLEELSDALSENADSDKFHRIWESFPKPLRFILLAYLTYLSQIFFEYITEEVIIPYVTSAIQNVLIADSDNKRTKVNAIKNIPNEMCLYVDNGVRFISGTGVNLRESDSIKSPIIAKLNVGIVVHLQEKHRSWSRVIAYLEDGETLEGWVLTEYTERFR